MAPFDPRFETTPAMNLRGRLALVKATYHIRQLNELTYVTDTCARIATKRRETTPRGQLSPGKLVADSVFDGVAGVGPFSSKLQGDPV